MRAIMELTNEESINFSGRYKELKETSENDMKEYYLEESSTKVGYAHYTFSGKIKKEFIGTLGSNDLIMIIDGGFSHFGASCSIDEKSGNFNGRVNTD